MFRLNGSKDIFKQHILSSQMDDCLPCENFCPLKSTNVKAFQAHIFCAIFWLMKFNGTNGKDINVNVEAVNIDNVPKRRQTLSLFSRVSLKDSIT